MDDNENRFEVISSKTSKANFKHTNGFGKTVLLPFCSGIVGCALVIGTCFGVPSIKNKIIGEASEKLITEIYNVGNEINKVNENQKEVMIIGKKRIISNC